MQNKTITTCENCPNNFECPLMAYSLADRKAACSKLSLPHIFPVRFSATQEGLVIPEDQNNWERRLLQFQILGDWVREGERVGRLDSLADLSTYKEYDTLHDFEINENAN